MKEADVCFGFGDLKSVFHLGRGGVPLPVSLSRAQVSKAIHFHPHCVQLQRSHASGTYLVVLVFPCLVVLVFPCLVVLVFP